MKKVFKWIKARGTEPSTYVGVGAIVALAGAPKLGFQITQMGEAVGMILGGGLIAHRSFTPKD
jgi:hypothetical protein